MAQMISLGMYTVHKSAAKDMAGTFKKVRELGYGGIEFYGEPSDFDSALVNDAISSSGLVLTSWHIEWRNLQRETISGTMEYLKKVKCPIAVVPCLGGKWNVNHTPDRESLALWENYVTELNKISRTLKENGIRMGYHNHEHEFLLEHGGRKVFDILFEGLNPDIIMEFDTGNCIEGGSDPAGVLKKYQARDVLLHLKPYSHQLGFNVVLGGEQDMNDWPAIFNSSGKDFLQLIVESECETLDEFENARLCLDGLKANNKINGNRI